MTRASHSGQIAQLRQDECFVFGANQAGRHGAGAARQARLQFGAQPGVGQGPTGRCYALPTKARDLSILPIARIRAHADVFLAHARAHPDTRFLLTAVGCGLAGYVAADIAPLFAHAPANVVMPPEFLPYCADVPTAREHPAASADPPGA